MSTTTPTTLADRIQHESWCGPMPGETERRTETFRTQPTDDRGRPTRSVTTARCIECAEQVVQG